MKFCVEEYPSVHRLKIESVLLASTLLTVYSPVSCQSFVARVIPRSHTWPPLHSLPGKIHDVIWLLRGMTLEAEYVSDVMTSLSRRRNKGLAAVTWMAHLAEVSGMKVVAPSKRFLPRTRWCAPLCGKLPVGGGHEAWSEETIGGGLPSLLLQKLAWGRLVREKQGIPWTSWGSK